MRPTFRRLLSLVTATLTAACLAAAGEARAQSADEGSDFHLHQSFKPCGKKWLKRAARLSDEQRDWMLRREHRLYTLRVADRVLATVELLSTASFRDCDVERHWSLRETTVRVVTFSADGGRRTKLHHFAADEVFFDRSPRFYPGLGRAMLRGVTFDGRELSRWLPLDGLPALVAERDAPAPAAAEPLALADADPVTAAAGGM